MNLTTVNIPTNPKSKFKKLNDLWGPVDEPDFKRFRKLAGHYAVLAQLLKHRRHDQTLNALWLVPAEEADEFKKLLRRYLPAEVKVRRYGRGKRRTRRASHVVVAEATSFAYYER